MKPLIHWTRCMVVVVLVSSCAAGVDDVVIPPPPPPTNPTVDPETTMEQLFYGNSVGLAGGLAGALGVRVLRNGVALQGAVIFWGAEDGVISPTTTLTDVDGISRHTNWRLGTRVGIQSAWAALASLTGARIRWEVDARGAVAGSHASRISIQGIPEGEQIAGARSSDEYEVWVSNAASFGVEGEPIEIIPTEEGQAAFPTSSVSGPFGFTSFTIRLAPRVGTQGFRVRLTNTPASQTTLSVNARPIPVGGSGPIVRLTLRGSSRFVPEIFSVVRGTSVEFVWSDANHGIRFVSAPTTMPDVGLHESPYSTIIRFDVPGVYLIDCPNHGAGPLGMRVTLTVT